MNRIIPLFPIFLTLVCSACLAQITYLPACSSLTPFFCVDAAYFLDGGDYAVEVYFEICNEGLQFVKTDGRFKGQVDVSVVLLDNKDRQIAGDTYRLRLYASKYEATTSVDSCRTRVLKFKARPGSFKLVVNAYDTDSKAKSTIEGLLKIPDMDKLPTLSDLVLLRKSTYPAGERWGDYVPAVKRKLNVSEENIALYYEVYCHDKGDSLILTETISDKHGDVVVKRQSKIFGMGRVVEIADPGVDSLSNGHYRLLLALASNDGSIICERKKEFDVRSESFYFDRDVEGAVALLTYIASGSFIDAFVKADPKERKRLWEEFWREKDPTPQTPKNEFYDEHVRRFHYANEHFGTSMTEGWRTDRGRIYITYGEPDEVERYPGEVRRKPMEIWYYYSRGKRFIFVDETGFGDYVLVGEYR